MSLGDEVAIFGPVVIFGLVDPGFTFEVFILGLAGPVVIFGPVFIFGLIGPVFLFAPVEPEVTFGPLFILGLVGSVFGPSEFPISWAILGVIGSRGPGRLERRVLRRLLDRTVA